MLREAYRYTSENPAIGRMLARGRQLAPDLSDAKRNIHHHYDIGNDFYKLWLDREALQYTCAYFADPAMTIEQAQQAKMHHVCRKLQLKPGERVVEAGGGWGGFALFMAKNYGARVRSFNISQGTDRAFARVGEAARPRRPKSSSSRTTTAISRAPTTHSSRSACSSTSARATTRSSEP